MLALNNKRLINAVTRGDTNSVGKLLRSGSDANTVDPYTRESVLHISVTKGYEAIIHALLEAGANANSSSLDQTTPLHIACRVGSIIAVSALLDHKAILTSRNKDQQTPLQIAILHGHGKLVRLLLSRGSPINEVYSDGTGPLQLASKEGNAEAVRALLDYGAGRLSFAQGANTPLHFATRLGRTDIMNLLIKQGANVNARGYKNASPLHWACFIGKTDAAKLLLDTGADMAIITDDGKTALMLAKENGHCDLVQLFERHACYRFNPQGGTRPRGSGGAGTATPEKMFAAAKMGRSEELICWLQDGVDPNIKNDKGDTPLHVACMGGHLDIVRALLMHNAHVNECNTLDNTPLHNASRAGNLDVVCLLADKNAKIDPKGFNGTTPLHWASYAGHSPVVEELLDRGADVKLTTNDGKTALDLAVSKSFFQVAAILDQAMSIPSRFFHILFSKQDDLEADRFLDRLSKNVRTVQEMKIYYSLLHAHVAQKQTNLECGKQWLARALANTACTCGAEQTLACYKTILKKCRDDGLLDEHSYHVYDNRAEIRRIENAEFILDMKATIQQHAARIKGLEGKIESLEKNLELLDRNIKSVNKAHEDLKKGLRVKMKIEATVGMITGVLNLVSGGIAGGICPLVGKLAEHIVDFGDVAHIASIIVSEAANPQEASDSMSAFEKGVVLAERAIKNVGNKMIEKKLEEALKKGDPLVVLGISATFVNPDQEVSSASSRATAVLVREEPCVGELPSSSLKDLYKDAILDEDDENSHPLHAAVKFGNKKLLEVSLRNLSVEDCDEINAVDSHGRSAMDLAALTGQIELMEMIENCGGRFSFRSAPRMHTIAQKRKNSVEEYLALVEAELE